MAFSTDEDLLAIQPSIFDYGISSFEEYHETAAEETARDLRTGWIPRQRTVKEAEFDRYALDEAQWRRAACYRVLGWHILPLLAGKDVATEFWLAMATSYKKAYREEMDAEIDVGVFYLVEGSMERIRSVRKAETARMWR